MCVCVEVCGRLNRCAKTGNFSAMSHTGFELNPIQNDRVKVDFGCGLRESGPKVLCHLKPEPPITRIPFFRRLSIRVNEYFIFVVHRSSST